MFMIWCERENVQCYPLGSSYLVGKVLSIGI